MEKAKLNLYIRSKFDLDRADQLIELGYPGVIPYIPNMMEWIQDMNWPVAQRLAPFLASLGDAVVPEIRKVLDGDDPVWKYWCISLIGRLETSCFENFRSDLERLAANPTDAESYEELDEIAATVLAELENRGQKSE